MMQETLLAALEAGAKEIEYFFNKKYKISNKEGINNLVTEADFASDKAIRKVIRTAFPDHGIISEESDEKTTQTDYR